MAEELDFSPDALTEVGTGLAALPSTRRVHTNPLEKIARVVADTGKVMALDTASPSRVTSCLKRAVRDINAENPTASPLFLHHRITPSTVDGKKKYTFTINRTQPKRAAARAKNVPTPGETAAKPKPKGPPGK